MILEVEMINWRAYEKRSFAFKPGLNYIMGPNGKGKTSILEAIVYALTGEPSIVSNRDHLLRNPEKPATVRLTFKVDEKIYRIERTQLPGKAGDASLYDVAANKRLAYYHKNVTEKVEELIGVSADFLRRIVYMAEGDVFRFLQDPPGKAMNQQVQRVLGLTQLDQYQAAINIAQKDLKDKSKALKSLQERIAELQITPEQSLESMIAYLDTQREKLMHQVLAHQDELTRLQEQTVSLSSLGQHLERGLDGLRMNQGYWEQAQGRSLVMYYEQLRDELDQRREKEISVERELAHLSGAKQSYQRVLELLSITDAAQDEAACPVCKKPMTQVERHRVVLETKGELDRIERAVLHSKEMIDLLRNEFRQTQIFLENLREIRNNIVHTRIIGIHPDMTLPQIMDVVRQGVEQPRQHELHHLINAIQSQVDELEKARANFIAIYNQLQEDGFSYPGDVQDALVKIETRLLTLNAAEDAAEKTLADMRDGGLGAIYDQIAAVWDNFIQRGNWHMRFDPEGNPLLAEETEREFNFGQFSGGEKTALLVIIHTVIAHHFSKCKFLMVDEPLEHLDPVNRRSLMRFFVGACGNEFFDQALITTYEESLVRKYISDEQVNIIYIR